MSLKARLLGGTTLITLAEGLILPTGFVTLTFLTRQLGTDGYGLFALTATIVTWVEWGLNSVFSRTTIKFVSEAKEKSDIATAVVRAQLGCGMLAAAGVMFAAPAIANLLHEPTLVQLLRLFALEIPLVNIAQAHQNILAGMGKFSARAAATAVRWIARLLLIVVFVQAGLSIAGAILGSLAAMLADLLVCRCYVRPSLWQHSNFPLSALTGYAIPLFMSALALRLYAKLDLLAFKALGGSADQAGIYAVGQNLALFGGVMSPALAPVLIATVSELLSQGEINKIKLLSQAAMRVVLLHLPFVGLLAGTARELVLLLFGEAYLAAAPLFSLLLLATIGTVMLTVTSAVLVASDRPRWTALLTVPLPVVALLGHWLLVPEFGAMGAATTTVGVAWLGAIAGIVAVNIRWQVLPPILTLVRCCGTGVIGMITAAYWSTSGLWLGVKLCAITIGMIFLLWIFGEISAKDKQLFRAVLNKKTV